MSTVTIIRQASCISIILSRNSIDFLPSDDSKVGSYRFHRTFRTLLLSIQKATPLPFPAIQCLNAEAVCQAGKAPSVRLNATTIPSQQPRRAPISNGITIVRFPQAFPLPQCPESVLRTTDRPFCRFGSNLLIQQLSGKTGSLVCARSPNLLHW